MISRISEGFLVIALVLILADARAMENEGTPLGPDDEVDVATESAAPRNSFDAPGPPPDGTGVVSVDRVASGSRDGETGTYYVTVLFDYIDGTLVDVEGRVRFVSDDDRAHRGR